ncbi:uncharacterized protein N0V89_005336 [Didymosphaeria variabile]|uniref:Uncharacterized protein n=1 Tax=Didymosphaeria variabile TaxID=1932322 RepID=A0A9W8XL57_9PLEO|nr:uncharacterized protein N0V89_005336 [Didymosphaeria variabile]KAJ4353606.1 hypothetical protein N0V89_005336 [Didymosphaeria variabile]
MHAFKVLGSVALFALSVVAQEAATPASAMPVVTMMWGDSKPTDAALAASAESAMSSQMATAQAEMSMSGSMSGSMSSMSMSTATTMPMSEMSGMSSMSGMSMETASATGMVMGSAPREGVWGSGVALAMMGVGAALVV